LHRKSIQPVKFKENNTHLRFFPLFKGARLGCPISTFDHKLQFESCSE
jgi:hypothetical protein